MKTPFSRPQHAPARMPPRIARTTGTPARISSATTTVQNAILLPTESSICPTSTAMVSASASSKNGHACLIMFIALPHERKFSPVKAKIAMMIASIQITGSMLPRIRMKFLRGFA